MEATIQIINLPLKRWGEYKSLHLLCRKEYPCAYGSSYEEDILETDDFWKLRLEDKRNIMFFAEYEGELVGMIVVLTNKEKHIQHVADIVGISVHPNYVGKGIGTALMKEAINKAKEREIEKLELTVVTTQASAIKLYKKLGYISVGIAKKAMKVDNQYYDEFVMEKILS